MCSLSHWLVNPIDCLELKNPLRTCLRAAYSMLVLLTDSIFCFCTGCALSAKLVDQFMCFGWTISLDIYLQF
ncbi:unnamed protein product [Trifolium pratense]|uniref:Uncharacterized protein n=1 Tax=Trifolium pratense TaxID=57577 RepID=A0ACB0KAH5_TRIPR|nr:unnamed protein product [Trifolium pratense]